MTRRRGLLLAAAGVAALVQRNVRAQASPSPAAPTAVSPSAPQTPASAPPAPVLKALGGDRYQVGRIVVDKGKRRFTVPGRIRALDKPLEFLATLPGAKKAYESLLELTTSGIEFNLACILVGLERDKSVPPERPLLEPVGPRVALSVAWTAGGRRQVLTAADALFGTTVAGRDHTLEWIYTGSFTSRDGSHLAADVTGTLVSFVRKDPTGVIALASAVELGPYGAIRGSDRLPPEGSEVELIVDAGLDAK